MAIRAFIAIDTPSHIRDAMVDVQNELKASRADVKWEPQEKLHATIKFLGNVEEKLLPALLDTIRQITQTATPFDITYGGVGCFPSINRPRVIWIGCENDTGVLASVKKSLDDSLLRMEFEVETREFHPHVTLGRVKSPRGLHALTPLLQTVTFDPHRAACKQLVLMKSVLKSSGAEYSIIQAFPLG